MPLLRPPAPPQECGRRGAPTRGRAVLRVEEGPVSSLGSALSHPSRERARSSPATSEVFLKPGPARRRTERGVPTATRGVSFVAQGGQGLAKAMAVRRGSELSPGSHAVCRLPGAPWAPPGWQPPQRTHSFLSAETHSEGLQGGGVQGHLMPTLALSCWATSLTSHLCPPAPNSAH